MMQAKERMETFHLFQVKLCKVPRRDLGVYGWSGIQDFFSPVYHKQTS